jgi:hypothetical protein
VASKTSNRARRSNGDAGAGIPGSASQDHPLDAIPLPAHGFETLDVPVRELASVPAMEAIRRAAVLLISAAAEKLGLEPGAEPDIDLDDARRLIDALAGLLAGAQSHLGEELSPLRDALRTLQKAFRETSVYPDDPGEGPGETLLR